MALIAVILIFVKFGKKCEFFANTLITFVFLIILPPLGIISMIILKRKLRKTNNEKEIKDNE